MSLCLSYTVPTLQAYMHIAYDIAEYALKRLHFHPCLELA